jgi:hypothetical protein
VGVHHRIGCDSQLGNKSGSQRPLRVSRESSFLFGGIGRVGAWQLGGELDKPERSSRRERTTEGKGNDIRQKGKLRQWSRNRLSPALPPYCSKRCALFSGCPLTRSGFCWSVHMVHSDNRNEDSILPDWNPIIREGEGGNGNGGQQDTASEGLSPSRSPLSR